MTLRCLAGKRVSKVLSRLETGFDQGKRSEEWCAMNLKRGGMVT